MVEPEEVMLMVDQEVQVVVEMEVNQVQMQMEQPTQAVVVEDFTGMELVMVALEALV